MQDRRELGWLASVRIPRRAAGLLARNRHPLVLLALASVALLLFSIPLDWGLPHAVGASWAFDEIRPDQAENLWSWNLKYPPLYGHLARGAIGFVELLSSWFDRGAEPGLTYRQKWLVMRSMSVLFSLLTLGVIYRIGRVIGGSRVGLMSACLVGLSPTYVFYAKTSNLEAVYLFFTALSIYFALLLLRDPSWRHAVALGMSAAASVGTKEQAWGLYPAFALAFVGLTWARYRSQAQAWKKMGRTVAATAVAATAGIATLLVGAYRWPWREDLLLGHWSRLFGGLTAEHYRQVPPTLVGQVELLGLSLRSLAFILSWAGLMAAAVGAVILWRRRGRARRRLLLFAIGALGFYLGSIPLLGFQAERYLLPCALLAAPVAAIALEGLWAAQIKAATLARLAVLIAFGWCFWRAVQVDAAMLRDSRYVVEEWVQSLPSDKRVVGFGRPLLLPHVPRLPWRYLDKASPCGALRKLDADYIIVGVEEWQPARKPFLRRSLLGEQLGYQVRRREDGLAVPLLAHLPEDMSNLEKISPTTFVLARSDQEPCRDRPWSMREAGLLLEAPRAERIRKLARFLAEFWHPGRRTLLPGRAYATGLDPDSWTYGKAPAALVLVNPGDRDWKPRVALRGYVAVPGRPQLVELLIDGRRRDLRLEHRRWRRLALSPIAPGERSLLLVRSEAAGRPSPGSKKSFGVRLRVAPPDERGDRGWPWRSGAGD